eukprot:7741151-Karenia_brevis.AAC.1
MLKKPIPSSVTSPRYTSSHSVFGTFASSLRHTKTEAARTSDKQVYSAQDSYQVLNTRPTQAYRRDMDVNGAANIGPVMHSANPVSYTHLRAHETLSDL